MSVSTSLVRLVRLIWTEIKLIVREPIVLIFVFFFPILIALILGGVFEPEEDVFLGAIPTDYYTSAYVAVAIGAIGLIMVPVQVASYRERGVLRRFRASGFPGWIFPAALAIVGFLASILAAILVVLTMHLTYGVSAPASLPRTLVFGAITTMAFVSFGLLLGWLMPTARSAQGLGMLAFFPMFMLGGGGPPPEALSDTMNTIADFLPLTHVMRALQEPWLDAGNGFDHLLIVTLLGIASTGGWLTLSRRAVSA